jgi:hypothetical protein
MFPHLFCRQKTSLEVIWPIGALGFTGYLIVWASQTCLPICSLPFGATGFEVEASPNQVGAWCGGIDVPGVLLGQAAL